MNLNSFELKSRKPGDQGSQGQFIQAGFDGGMRRNNNNNNGYDGGMRNGPMMGNNMNGSSGNYLSNRNSNFMPSGSSRPPLIQRPNVRPNSGPLLSNVGGMSLGLSSGGGGGPPRLPPSLSLSTGSGGGGQWNNSPSLLNGPQRTPPGMNPLMSRSMGMSGGGGRGMGGGGPLLSAPGHQGDLRNPMMQGLYCRFLLVAKYRMFFGFVLDLMFVFTPS